MERYSLQAFSEIALHLLAFNVGEQSPGMSCCSNPPLLADVQRQAVRPSSAIGSWPLLRIQLEHPTPTEGTEMGFARPL